jgi:hypothetical protein
MPPGEIREPACTHEGMWTSRHAGFAGHGAAKVTHEPTRAKGSPGTGQEFTTSKRCGIGMGSARLIQLRDDITSKVLGEWWSHVRGSTTEALPHLAAAMAAVVRVRGRLMSKSFSRHTSLVVVPWCGMNGFIHRGWLDSEASGFIPKCHRSTREDACGVFFLTGARR